MGAKSKNHQKRTIFDKKTGFFLRKTPKTLVKRIIANKNIVIFKVNNTELFCQVELPLSDYPLYGKQIAAS